RGRSAGAAPRSSNRRVGRCKARCRPRACWLKDAAMRHPALLDRDRAVLVVIDIQEGYRPALYAWDRVVTASALILQGANVLGVPVVVTEQYPRGVGHTAPEVAANFPRGIEVVEKMTMSCCGADEFVTR